jgi:hypothetical protein
VAAAFMISGLAIMLACNKILKQLSGFKESSQSKLQIGGMHQWVRQLVFGHVSLIGIVL